MQCSAIIRIEIERSSARKVPMPKSEFVRLSQQARISLDSKRIAMQSASRTLGKPRGGWIQTIRTGLGMSTTDLSNRLKVTPSTVHRLEKSEIAGTINLESLKKVAEELGCELVYALVPRQDLELVVKKRAFELATEKLKQTQSTMALEQQELQVDVLNKLIEQKARELVESRELWKAAVKDVR